MKKAITFLTVLTLLASASFAQTAHRHVKMTKAEFNAPVSARLVQHQASTAVKAAGDTISAFPWIENFESVPVGFTFIDNDGDGDNWTRETERVTAHSGTSVIRSASWSQATGDPLTPDNWMILPAMQIPSNIDDFNLTWWAIGQDASYATEHYSVYICTTGNAVTNFTATTPVYDGNSTSEYVKHTVDLSSYAGQVVFIAFRHWNVTDMFWLNIDDIRVGGPEPPEVTISGPDNIEINTPATFTATGASTFSWEVDGTAQATTDSTLTYTFTTVGTHTVSASATNSAGTGTDTFTVNTFDCSAPITAMPWNEGFEGSIDCWHMLVADPLDPGFFLNGSGYAHDGDFCILGAYSDDINVDQWAISPLITIPAEGTNYILKYYVIMTEWEGVQTHYQVRLSTGSADTADFTVVLTDETGADGVYVPRTLQLGNYAGQTIRLAFRNITAMTGDAMMIDDIYVGVPLAPDMAITGPETVIMDEANSWTASTDVTSVVWTVDGTVVNQNGLTLDHTFTTAGSHTIIATATNVAGSTSDTLVVDVVDCSTVYDVPHTFNLATEFGLCWNNPEGGWDTISMNGTFFLYSMSNLYGIFDIDPDNWIYTPSLAMPASGSYEIAWNVMPYTTQRPTDHYGVYLIQNGNATLLRQETLTANITSPASRAVAIPEGVTGEFKIAFRHYETTGGYVILVNNIRVVAAGTTGIEDVNNADISIYPNPANDILNIRGENINEVELIDLNGRTIINERNAESLNIGSLPAGVYMVRVITSEGVFTQKVVKQ